MKCFFPPYSTDQARLYRDIFFINICGANIFLFPFLFFSKSDSVKDYMFFLGILGGGAAMLYPIEPMEYREFGLAVLNPNMLAPAVRQMIAHIEEFAALRRAGNAVTVYLLEGGDKQ